MTNHKNGRKRKAQELEQRIPPELIPELPAGILSDILSQLPIKPLFQFNLVCKDWKSLISEDPHFAKLQLSKSPFGLLIKNTPPKCESKILNLVQLEGFENRNRELKLHWLGSENSICSFDFVSEKFEQVPCPPWYGTYSRWRFDPCRLGALNVLLSLTRTNTRCLETWVMMEYGVRESWTKLFVSDKILCSRSLEPVGVLNNGDIVMIYDKEFLLSYQLKEEYFRFIPLGGRQSQFEAIIHIPSLVSLKGIVNGGNLKVCQVENEISRECEACLICSDFGKQGSSLTGDDDAWRKKLKGMQIKAAKELENKVYASMIGMMENQELKS
ncbi:F-box domain [Dillenia turbinata]|uniref:F-box domain n=1 Tax=Dillenia turbinata TaxID=194707 RepID=A0AAN8VSE6_9MAGN